jgi:inner membrane protease subunit 1
MLPTMALTGEICLENTLSHRLSPSALQRGDLVTLKSPLDPSRIICKRLIGLPGDVVCVDPTGTLAPSTEHVVVPKGHIWIAGDNAAASRDSRMYGPVSLSLVRGTLVARVRIRLFLPLYSMPTEAALAQIWPPTEFTVFSNNSTYID